MTLRIHRRGKAQDHAAPATQWQRERMRGRILPMEPERRSWWRWARH